MKNEIERLKHALRHYKGLAEKLADSKTRTEQIIEAMKDALSVMKPLPPVKFATPKSGYSPEHIVLLVSDAQAGTEVVGKELGLEKWEYNTDVFRYRLRLYLSGVMEIVNRHRLAYPVPEAHVWLGGDLIENDTLFPAQQVWVDSNAMCQFFMVQYEITLFLMELARRFKKVNVYCTVGNHGRVSSVKQNTDLVNWEYVLYRNIQWMLRGHKNIEMHVPLEWWQIREINGFRFCFIHGEHIVRYLSYPWYSTGRVHSNYAQFAQTIGKEFTYFVHGHHHTAMNLQVPLGEIIANGTFVGFTRYTTKKLSFSAVRPRQQVFFVHSKQGITGRYWLKLDLENDELWKSVLETRRDPRVPVSNEEFANLLKR